MKIEKKNLIVIFIMFYVALYFITLEVSSVTENDMANSIYSAAITNISLMFAYLRTKSEHIQTSMIIYLMVMAMFFHFTVWLIV